MSMKPRPYLLPEDLGIDLEEDSQDFTEEQATSAIETETADEFVHLVSEFVKEVGGGTPRYELKRRAGVLYSCVSVGDRRRTFRARWLKS